jgi:hypothetical protein
MIPCVVTRHTTRKTYDPINSTPPTHLFTSSFSRQQHLVIAGATLIWPVYASAPATIINNPASTAPFSPSSLDCHIPSSPLRCRLIRPCLTTAAAEERRSLPSTSASLAARNGSGTNVCFYSPRAIGLDLDGPQPLRSTSGSVTTDITWNGLTVSMHNCHAALLPRPFVQLKASRLLFIQSTEKYHSFFGRSKLAYAVAPPQLLFQIRPLPMAYLWTFPDPLSSRTPPYCARSTP